MKLLPLACFAVSAAQSGDYDYGAVDTTEEDDRHYGYSSYGNYDDYGNKKNKWSFGQYQGRAGGPGAIAVALNCWPANFDKDTLMKKMPSELNPEELHEFGPLHLYGSEMDSRYNAGSHTGDPGLRAGMGGHYHYGHAHSDAVENSAPSEWVHYHSARHAGCLYEIPDFSYNADSWNKIFHLYYYNGYYNTNVDPATALTEKVPAVPAGYTDPLNNAISFDANWVHFFNAHVLVSSGGHGASTDPAGQLTTNSIKLVMANPQYEGLGWLNFVATFARSGIATGTAYTEFADSTIVTLTKAEMDIACGGSGCETYTAINDASTAQQTQGTTGNFYYDAWMGTWELRRDTALVWNTQYTSTDTSGGVPGVTNFGTQQMAVSSFPHNELGKDFRFNMRVLLEDSTDSTRIMYYFYKINTITIEFPDAVAYALVHDGREDVVGATKHNGGSTSADPANRQGDGVYSVSQNSIRDNIIPPLDLGSHMDASFGEHVASTDEHHRITGYLSTDAADVCLTTNTACADFCKTPSTNCAIGALSCTATSLEEFCSTKFHITGLLNTYSERLGGQRGTYQEIWVQLQYAFRLVAVDGSASNVDVDGSATEQISSPFPYLHFMASEIESITFSCDLTNVDNGNTCATFVTPTTHDFGWGG